MTPPFFVRDLSTLSGLFVLVISSASYADTSRRIYSGITQTNNLEIQEVEDKSGNSNLSRTGFETGLVLSKQSLGPSGGYVFQSKFSLNKDLSGSADIGKLSFSASKLSALNTDWLMRNSIRYNQYKNEALLVNSFKGITLSSTFGYLNDQGGGTDILLSVKKERHDQVSDDRYDMTRSKLGLTYYFPRKKNKPYWSVQTALSDNNADVDSRDYNSKRVGLAYNQFNLASFVGRVGLNWQKDKSKTSLNAMPSSPFNETPAGNQSSFNPPNMMIEGGGVVGQSRKYRESDLYYLSLQLSKPFSKSLSLYFSGSLGQYQSSVDSGNESFYSVSSKLVWAF